jgi:nucleoid-associated protein YgaU
MIAEQTRSTKADFPEILVRWPQPHDLVDDPIEVSGISRAFEGSISIRVLDGNGKQLIEAHTQGGSMGTFGKFREEIALGSTPETPQGTVEVFEYSPRGDMGDGDNGEINKVVIPIVFGRNIMGRESYGYDTYEVKPGDTLSSIARNDYYEGTTWSQIFEANRYQIDDPDLIYPGQVLRIPR